QGWTMVGPNKSVPAGWNLKSTSGGLSTAPKVYVWNDVTDVYDESTGDAVRGLAYWVKDATGGRVFVPSDGFGSASETVQVRLKTGWNQIASGQYFFVSWDSSVVFDTSSQNDTALPASERLTAEQAGASNVLQNKVYWYTGSNYVYGPASETFSLTTLQLKPMVGFWLNVTTACTMYVYPNPAAAETHATEILTQSAKYSSLAAGYKQTGQTGNEQNWAVQLVASSGGVTDWQNYVGVKPTLAERRAAGALEAPGLASGYLTLAVRPSLGSVSSNAQPASSTDAWMAASYADPQSPGHAWDVVLSTDLGAATLTWDNVDNLPSAYEAYLIGAPGGAVNLRNSASLPFSLSPSLPVSLTLAIGSPEFVAPFIAAPLSKENTFIYPNPGPDDATGNMTFKYNLPSAADVSLKIFDMGGKLVKEMKGSGIAGSNTLTWDTTNKHGQRLGSGVYIYKLESGGTTLVDKLAIVR
ncbi:T9SS type A sorting domain-containing protein, partial [bacterium]|nr:T9SS type A sorting domain-containing protein [bacterium]